MNARGLLVVGAGGHGRVVADAALAAGLSLAGFADSGRAGQRLLGAQVGPSEPDEIVAICARDGWQVVVALGDNAARARVQLALVERGVPLATVVHPAAQLLGRARVGAGCMILAGAVIGVDAELGQGVIINTTASIDHDNQIGAFAHLSPGVHTGGEVVVGEGAHLAIGVSVRNRVSVGEWSVVGVGAAVVRDIPARVVALGVPARVQRAVP